MMKRLLLSLSLSAAGLFSQSVETIPYRAIMLTSNEVPPVTINASGTATMWLHVIKDAQGRVTSASTDFQVNFQLPGATRITGLHIHNGRAGENGPVRIDT